jgi:ligand-binding sensor domain-containing protein/signal transduction histidine kinase
MSREDERTGRLRIAGLAAGALLALFSDAPLLAQGLDPAKALTQYNLDVWTTADALPQNSVTAVVQTRDGYLWLGTYGGLARFDGVRFGVFDSANTPALRTNGVQALLEARDGTLWVGTTGGGLVRYRDGAFTALTTADGLPSDNVRTLHEDHEGVLWIGTNDGLARYKDGRFRTFHVKDGLSNPVVRALQDDGSGTLWIGTNGGGLDRLEGGRFRRFTTADGLSSNFVFALLSGQDGSLWIGTDGGGLGRLKDGRLQNFTIADGLPSNIVWSLHEDGQGTLWVGTYGGGLARFRDGRFSALTTRDGLSNDFVRAVTSDREASLWIGTYSGGLCRLRDGKFTTYTTSEGLKGDFARTVFEDRDHALWIGTTGGGLCRMKDGAFRCYDARSGLHDDVRALHQDEDGALWIGTVGAGLFRLKQGRFTRYTTTDGLAHANVSSISADRKGGLWIGTNGGGLSHFERGRFTTYGTAQGLSVNFVLATLVDREGVVWVGTDGGGLSRLENGSVTTFRKKDGLAGDIVFCLHDDEQGALWIGTSGGLSRIHQGRLSTLTTRQGLLDDVVFQILEDAEGRFWLSGNKGISRLDGEELRAAARGERPSVSPVGYGAADGMKSDECSGLGQPAGWRARDGRLWFPTARGVVVVDPSRIRLNTVSPPVEVERVVVDGEPVASLDVPPGRQRFEFHYTALSLVAPRKVEFKYKLDGFDPDWIGAGPRRTAYYTRLPPGRYTFRVTASNNDGVWNADGASVALTVQPYFTETIWFYLLSGLGLMLAGAGVYRLRVRSLRRRQRELEVIVERRTHDLLLEKERSEAARQEAERARSEAERQKEVALAADHLKGEMLSIAAHDLKTPLQSMIGYGDLLAAEGASKAAVEYAGYSTRSAQRMLDIVNRLLQSDSMERGGLPVLRQAVNVGDLALAIAGSLQPHAEAKKQRIHASAAPSCLVEGDEEWLRQVLENLVGNAIKYSPPRCSIWVDVKKANGTVRLEVRDEGPGLTEDDKARLFGRFQRGSARPTGGESATGLGLSIVKQLVELHSGQVWAESGGRGEGARFVVELPATEAAPPKPDAQPVPRGE